MKHRPVLMLLCLTIVIMFASGCATPMAIGLNRSEQRYIPSGDPNKALIYVYREREFMGCARGIFVTANGKRVGGLNNGTYFVYETDPGEVVMSVENWLGDDPSRKINAKAGERYYLKGLLKMGFWDFAPSINIVAKEEGEGAIQELTYATIRESDLKETVK